MLAKRRYRNCQCAVIVISIILLFGFKFIPAPAGLSQGGFQVLGILIGALALWLFVAVDWTSMLVLFALMLVPVVTPAQVISGSLGNSTVFFPFCAPCSAPASRRPASPAGWPCGS